MLIYQELPVFQAETYHAFWKHLLIEVLKSLRRGSGTGVRVSKLIDGVVLRCNRSVDLQGEGGPEMLRRRSSSTFD